MSAKLIRLVFVGLLVIAPATSLRGEQSDQTRLAADLVGMDAEVRARALAKALTIPVEDRSDVLWSALSSEFKRTVSELVRKRGAGLPVTEADVEYLGDALQSVSRSEDQTLVPMFVQLIDSGQMVVEALGSHGEVAAPAVLTIAEDDDATGSEVAAALNVLTRMLTGPVRTPLSAQSRQRTVRVAQRRLNAHKDSLSVVLRAIDLAAATGDAALRAEVQQIASDRPGELRFGGFPASAQDAIRKRASEAARR